MPQQVPERPHRAVRLQVPLQVGSDRIDVVYVLRPKGKEMRLAPVPQAGQKLVAGEYHGFAAKLCGLTVAEFEELDAGDYAAVMQAVNEVSAEFPQTGSSAAAGSPASSTSSAPSS